MSLLDDFDTIVEKQTNNPDYQRYLEMLEWIEKYPRDWEGLSAWFIRRAFVYHNMGLGSLIKEDDKIYYGIVPYDVMSVYGAGFEGAGGNTNYFVAVRDGGTGKVKSMFLTAKEYCEFVKLKHYELYELTR